MIGRITEPRYAALIEEQNGSLAGVAGVLTDFAATERHDDLVKLVHTFCDRLDADGPEPDPTEQRRLSVAKRADGRVFFRGELDALGGEKFLASLESHMQADRPAGDTRSRAQQLADVLAAAGMGTPEHADLWTALMTGLASQQVSNDPCGDRWRRLLEPAVEMFLAQHLPA